MADRKISELDALTTPASGDYLPIVDVSEAAAADKNKRITVSELLRGAPNGTAAAPGFSFESDGDNGMFRSGTNAVGFSTAGSQRVTIDSAGRLLVGTSSAIQSRQIESATTGGNNLGVYRFTNGAGGSDIWLYKSRGASIGAHGAASNGDTSGAIQFALSDGTNYLRCASIDAQVDGTPGTNDMPGRLVFYTTADGESSPTERMRITNSGSFFCPGMYNDTTAQAAQMNVTSTGQVRRSTSSIKYKTSVETIEDSYADALLNCRPVWYRSTCKSDNPDYGYWGFIAEEVAEIDPRLVHWKTTNPVQQEDGSFENVPCKPEPEGVQYDRFVPHLLNLIKRQQQAIETLEAKVAALESA